MFANARSCAQSFSEITAGGATRNLENDNFITFRLPPSGGGNFSLWTMFGFSPIAYGVKVGWKAHISIDDSTQENLSRAWDLLLPILLQYQINTGKIVRIDPEGYRTPLSRVDARECGKQMVVYCFRNTANNAVNWEHFFRDVTQVLRDNYIRPAPISPNVLAVQGSEYITYRNDSDGQQGYISSEYPPHIPDIHGPDPFIDINLETSLTGNPIPRPQFPVHVPEQGLHAQVKFD